MTHTATLAKNPALKLEEMRDETFWREHFREFSIGTRLEVRAAGTVAPKADALAHIKKRMMLEGYFSERDDMLTKSAPKLAAAARTCQDLGLPPVFLFIFDEAWECFYRLHPVLSHFLGDNYKLLPDFWAWFVKPDLGQGGWSPHRDKGGIALAPDGSPLSLTVWIPLSEANPLNSCIYLVPANLDPTYNTPQQDQLKFQFSSVRALPGQPGDYFCWNQAVFHWGSQSSPFGAEPRISMAFEFQRGDMAPFNSPQIPPFFNVTFPDRLRLIAKQILQYQHMYGFSAELHALATRITQA